MMSGYRLRYREPQTYLQSYMHMDTFAGSLVRQLMHTIIDDCSSAQVTHKGRSEVTAVTTRGDTNQHKPLQRGRSYTCIVYGAVGYKDVQ